MKMGFGVDARIVRDARAQLVVPDEPLDPRDPGGIRIRHQQSRLAVSDTGVVHRHVGVDTRDAAGGVLPELVVALAAMKLVVWERRQPDIEALARETLE